MKRSEHKKTAWNQNGCCGLWIRPSRPSRTFGPSGKKMSKCTRFSLSGVVVRKEKKEKHLTQVVLKTPSHPGHQFVSECSNFYSQFLETQSPLEGLFEQSSWPGPHFFFGYCKVLFFHVLLIFRIFLEQLYMCSVCLLSCEALSVEVAQSMIWLNSMWLWMRRWWSKCCFPKRGTFVLWCQK